VLAHDWQHVPYALAGDASLRKTASGWEFKSPKTVTLQIQGQNRLWLDGHSWPCQGPEGLIVPAGTHLVSSRPEGPNSDSTSGDLRLMFLSDELLACRTFESMIEFTYRSPARCLLGFSIRPSRILVDGVPAKITVLQGDKLFVVVAPSGEHRLSVSVK
jgi:hypothetical protein